MHTSVIVIGGKFAFSPEAVETAVNGNRLRIPYLFHYNKVKVLGNTARWEADFFLKL